MGAAECMLISTDGLPHQVEDKMSANQRRYMLMEQLKHIKKELGLEKVRATHSFCWRPSTRVFSSGADDRLNHAPCQAG
jgi:ATP-dependent Lon protease